MSLNTLIPYKISDSSKRFPDFRTHIYTVRQVIWVLSYDLYWNKIYLLNVNIYFAIIIINVIRSVVNSYFWPMNCWTEIYSIQSNLHGIQCMCMPSK